jgi:hypothetical protein
LWKIVVIVILEFFSAGCSVIRNTSNRDLEISKEFLSENILESVKNQNITNDNFFIQKAEIEIITQNSKERLIGSVKFIHPDKYLISIKGRTGIEGARIYTSGDTILINDRINKKMYSVSSLFLKRKYGLSTNFLPLFFGDVILEKNSERNKASCSGDKLNFDCAVQGIFLNYEINCKKGKTILVKQHNSVDLKSIDIKYSSFIKSGNLLMPENIELIDSQNNIKLKIKVVKMQQPWNGRIEFIPGRDYEIIELL